MSTSAKLAVAAIALFAAAPSLASAKSIKSDVPSGELAAYCSEHGVGSQTMAAVTLADGSVLTGSVHCESEDLVVGDLGDEPDEDDVEDADDDSDEDDDDESGEDSDDDESDDEDNSGPGSHDDDDEDNSGPGSGDDDDSDDDDEGDEDDDDD